MKKIICLLLIISTSICTQVSLFAMDYYDPDSIEPVTIITATHNDAN